MCIFESYTFSTGRTDGTMEAITGEYPDELPDGEGRGSPPTLNWQVLMRQKRQVLRMPAGACSSDTEVNYLPTNRDIN